MGRNAFKGGFKGFSLLGFGDSNRGIQQSKFKLLSASEGPLMRIYEVILEYVVFSLVS